MLVEAQPPARTQDPADLVEGLPRAARAAQDQRADHRVAGGVRDRQAAGVAVEDAQRGRDPRVGRGGAQEAVGLDQDDLVDSGRVAGELHPVARADLQDGARQAVEQPCPLRGRPERLVVSRADRPGMVELLHSALTHTLMVRSCAVSGTDRYAIPTVRLRDPYIR
ncbi:hypothetical protein HerbRD11066_74480 [Herbidospora sp. RD11066]